MSDLQPRGPKIELGGEERELLFTLRAVDEIQDRFKKPVSEIVAMLGNAEGIYEVLPEDLALCEYIDPSKNYIQDIVRKGIDLMIQEMA